MRRVAKRVQQMRFLSFTSTLNALFPIGQYLLHIPSRLLQRLNVCFDILKFFLSKLVNATAGNAPTITSFQHLGQFSQRESDAKCPLHNQHSFRSALRVNAITRRCSPGLGQNSDLFIMSNCVWTHAGCLGESAGTERLGTFAFHHKDYQPWNAFQSQAVFSTSRSNPDCYHALVPTTKLIALIAVFFFTSMISVVTGSTSLITVPVMIQVGIEPHAAIATNMMALVFMSLGGTVPFLRGAVVPRRMLPGLIAVTIIGSTLGALLLLQVSTRALELIIAMAMAGIVIFSVAKRDFGMVEGNAILSGKQQIGGYAAAFLLAIYGGFFSGGYVTLLTTALILLAGMTLLQSVATTKIINIFSSAAATVIFVRRGLVDWRLGALLGLTMFLGAMIGGYVTLKLNPLWIRRIFVAAALGLAVKMALGAFGH